MWDRKYKTDSMGPQGLANDCALVALKTGLVFSIGLHSSTNSDLILRHSVMDS